MKDEIFQSKERKIGRKILQSEGERNEENEEKKKVKRNENKKKKKTKIFCQMQQKTLEILNRNSNFASSIFFNLCFHR